MKNVICRAFTVLAAGLCAGQLSAKETAWSASRVNDWDWTLSGNFTNGSPEAGDVVSVPENMTVYATNDAARALLNTLSFLELNGSRTGASNQGDCCVLVIDVPAGEYVLNVPLHAAKDSAALGIVRKTGSGTLALAVRDNRDQYRSDFDVLEGTLDLQSLVNVAYRFGALGIAKDATVIGPDATFFMHGIHGEGLLTNNASTDRYYRAFSGKASDPYVFSGKITGKISFRTYGAQYLTGTDSDNSLAAVYSESAKSPGVLGVQSFGSTAEDPSSIGFGKNLSFMQHGGRILYLGSGEVTEKGIKIYEDSAIGPAVVDGGEHGGLVINGAISTSPSTLMASLTLDGDHEKPCVIGGHANYAKDANGNWCSVHFVKRGSGIWRFEGSTNRSNSTGISIEEGTLQFDDIAEKGQRSGLGSAYVTHSNYYGAFDATKLVPWAFALGTATTEGTFEYVGSNGAYCVTRPIGLAGDGRLSCASDAPLRFAGVMPVGTGARRFTLAGSGTNENTIADIVDTVDCPVTLVKEGTGNWILANTNALHGGLEVDSGRLTVRNPSGRYDWFRWTVRKTFGLYSGAKEQHVQANQFGLYDESLNRVNCGWTQCDDFARIAPGQAAYQSRTTYTDKSNYMNENGLGELFDPITNRTVRWSVLMPDEIDPSVPSTHLKIVMRATNGTPEVARYDFAVRYNINNNGHVFNPESWCLEGSRDGIHWDTLHDMTATNAAMCCRTSHYHYYAANRTSSTSLEYNLTTTDKAPEIPGSVDRNVDVMSGFAYVKVAEGAVLAADGDGLEISSLRVDSAGAGTIQGFKFAENGTLDAVGVGSSGRVALPGTYSDVSGFPNIASWTLTVDGEATRRRITVEGDSIVLVNPGMRVILR